LIAITGFDGAAEAFYREHIKPYHEVTVRLIDENEILKAITGTADVARPQAIAARIDRETGTTGGRTLICTEKGLFWIQYIIPPNKETARQFAVFDGKGNPLSDRPTLEYLTNLHPELAGADSITLSSTVALQPGLFQEAEDIVEVQGSLQCFQYRLPASPGHFVGRQPYLEKLDAFATNIINKESSCRGVLLEAPSGWGKSSIALAWSARLREEGHYATVIDTRSLTSSRSVAQSLEYAFGQWGDFGGRIFSEDRVKSFRHLENAVRTTIETGRSLERHGLFILIFFDQFEHIVLQQNLLKRFRQLFQMVSDAQTHVAVGFSWKTNLEHLPQRRPHGLDKTFREMGKPIILDCFTAVDIDAFMEKLSDELHEPLKKDLQFHLAESSQGYPWLLKMLCRRVIDLRQKDIPPSDIAGQLISIETLFHGELHGLSSETATTLRRIAKAAPVRKLESNAKYDSDTVQSLIDQGLLIPTGSTYDVYGDIFRDFLTDGTLPARDNYLLLAKTDHVLWATRVLQKSNGLLNALKLKAQAALSEKAFYHVIRDMHLLGLAKMDNGNIVLEVDFPKTSEDFEMSWRNHLHGRLGSNHHVQRLLKALKDQHALTLADAARTIENFCLYISASRQTWLTHARIFANWMDAADLTLFDSNKRVLTRYDSETEIRERHLLLHKRHGTKLPQIQYSPVEDVAMRLVQALQKEGGVDWKGLKKNTIFRALATLEDLGFIQRRTRLIRVLPKGFEFVSNPDRRPRLFAEGALQMESFAAFMEILNTHKHKRRTLSALGQELRQKLGAGWKESTAEKMAKIMLDWARHSKLAPGVFAQIQKGPVKGWKKKKDVQMPLF